MSELLDSKKNPVAETPTNIVGGGPLSQWMAGGGKAQGVPAQDPAIAELTSMFNKQAQPASPTTTTPAKPKMIGTPFGWVPASEFPNGEEYYDKWYAPGTFLGDLIAKNEWGPK